VDVRRAGVARGAAVIERDEDVVWGMVGVRDVDCGVCFAGFAAAGATSTLLRNDDEAVVWYVLVLSVDTLER